MTNSALRDFELFVLLGLIRSGTDAYGMRVRQEIARQTGREVSIGAVYATLHRLEGKGLVRSETTAPRPVQGGRSRRIYSITPDGLKRVRETTGMISRLAQGLDLGAVR